MKCQPHVTDKTITMHYHINLQWIITRYTMAMERSDWSISVHQFRILFITNELLLSLQSVYDLQAVGQLRNAFLTGYIS